MRVYSYRLLLDNKEKNHEYIENLTRVAVALTIVSSGTWVASAQQMPVVIQPVDAYHDHPSFRSAEEPALGHTSGGNAAISGPNDHWTTDHDWAAPSTRPWKPVLGSEWFHLPPTANSEHPDSLRYGLIVPF